MKTTQEHEGARVIRNIILPNTSCPVGLPLTCKVLKCNRKTHLWYVDRNKVERIARFQPAPTYVRDRGVKCGAIFKTCSLEGNRLNGLITKRGDDERLHCVLCLVQPFLDS